MTSPVSGAQDARAMSIIETQPLLPQQQKNIVRVMYLVSVAISVTGLGLIAASAGYSNADLNKSQNMIISSLRFPCVIFGMSLLCCAEFTSKYFKRVHEMQRELSPFLIHEINRQIKEQTNLVPSVNSVGQRG